MKHFILILAFLLLISSVFAHEENLNISQYLEDREGLQTNVNQRLSSLSSYGSYLLGDEKINLKIGNDTNFGIVLKNGKIIDLKNETLEDSDLDVYLSLKDVHDIADAENKFAEIKRKISNKEIKYNSHGIRTYLKITMFRAFV